MKRLGNCQNYDILGVQVDAITIAEAGKLITKTAADPSSPAIYITKPYVEFLDLSSKDSEFQSLLNQSALCLPDGIALVWAANYLYAGPPGFKRLVGSLISIAINPPAVRQPLPEPFSGISFTLPLLALAANAKLKVFLIGSPKANSIGHTASYLQSKIHNLNIAGTWPGRMDKAGERALVSHLKNTKPDLILVGMGFPKQEFLMSRLSSQLDHGVMIGEGGTFDYRQFGGRVTRAPQFLRHLGLEWLWRLLREPKRLKRQLAIPRFIWRVYRQGRKKILAH